MPAVLLTASVTAVGLDGNGNAVLGETTRLGQVLESNPTHPYTISYPATNQVTITFSNRSIYSGTIILLG